MNTVTLLGIDIGKNTFHLHGQDARGHQVLRKKLNRNQLLPYLAPLIKDRQERLLIKGRALSVLTLSPDTLAQARFTAHQCWVAEDGLTIHFVRCLAKARHRMVGQKPFGYFGAFPK